LKNFTLIQLFACIFLIFLSSQYAQAQDKAKVISLSPHLTELTFAAGAGDLLVGVVDYSNFPEKAKAIPRIGNAFQLDYEKILLLQPDIILSWEGGTPKAVEQKLKELGLTVVSLKQEKLTDIADSILLIGTLTHHEEDAKRNAEHFLEELKHIKRHSSQSPISVFVQLSSRPIYTVNGSHIISEAIRYCGGYNIFHDLKPLSANVGMESIITRKPQLILSSNEEHLKMWQEVNNKNHLAEFLTLKPDLIYQATPRMLSGIKQLCQKIQKLAE